MRRIHLLFLKQNKETGNEYLKTEKTYVSKLHAIIRYLYLTAGIF